VITSRRGFNSVTNQGKILFIEKLSPKDSV